VGFLEAERVGSRHDELLGFVQAVHRSLRLEDKSNRSFLPQFLKPSDQTQKVPFIFTASMAFLLAAIIHLLVLFNAVIRACFALYGAMSTIFQGLIHRANNIIHNGIDFKQFLPNRATIAKTLFTILIQWLIRPLLSMALRATFNRIIWPMVSMALSTFHRRITRPIHRVFIRPVWKVTRKLLKIAVFLLAATTHVLIVLNAAVQACLVLYGAVSLTAREIISGARKVIHDGIQFHEILPDRGSIAKTLFKRIPNFWIQWLIRPMVSMVLHVTL